jgi:hypothetical protein
VSYRAESFARRFESAQPHLGVSGIRGLVSLKFRERRDVMPSEYSTFLGDHLGRNMGLDVTPLPGNFGGQAWLVSDKVKNRAILIEHETGLEILGAVGSIASLVALLPLISSGWTRLRNGLFPPRFDRPDNKGVEIRRLDQNDVLVEERVPSIEIYVLSLALQDNAVLKRRIDQLEGEIQNIKDQRPQRVKNKRKAKSERKTPRKK